MSHPYPPHRADLPYCGKHHYFLTFCVDQRIRVFTNEAPVALVRTQILRATREERFEVIAYCFMPDHLHLLVWRRDESSDAKRFIKLAKQYSAYYFKRQYGLRLWQRYGFERVIRDDAELAFTVSYILTNPVRAGLAPHPSNYPYIGSERYGDAELAMLYEHGTSA